MMATMNPIALYTLAEKDPTFRLRKAVKENNLFLVKRLMKRTDMRNPDPTYRRYTSLAWAAVLGHEETFEWLLNVGHDDHEISRCQDVFGNTILILLAEAKPPLPDPFTSGPSERDFYSATQRMARMYNGRYPEVIDWANADGRTAVHAAAMKGNEELLRILCDLGADFDLADNDGNTPLHYASAWGHVTIVQLLIERGCQYTARNNDGFTPSDYAYSMSTRDVLQDSARAQFELNKKARRNVLAARDWTDDDDLPPPRKLTGSVRVRSGSGTSRTTSTSDSGGDWNDNQTTPGRHLPPATSYTSSPSRTNMPLPQSGSATITNGFRPPSPQPLPTLSQVSNNIAQASLSPIATRMRERDAEAMEKYKARQRSGSAATTSTDAPSLAGSSALSSGNVSAPADDMDAFQAIGSVAPRRRLRPSASAAQLSSTPESASLANTPPPAQDSRNRSGTSPGILKRHPSTSTTHTTTTTATATISPPSETTVLQAPAPPSTGPIRPSLFRSINGHGKEKEKEKEKEYPGTNENTKLSSGQDASTERERSHTPILHSRRLPFNLLSHKHGTEHHHFGHKRNTSAHSLTTRT